MTDRTVALWEYPYDLGQLNANGLKFCVAKSVIDGTGKVHYNMVWRSLGLAPRAVITWTVQYGLNWTLDVPTAKANITVGGAWQPCNPGQVFDIDDVGLFQPSAEPPTPKFLKIGKNGYKYGGSSGISIVIGAKSADGNWEPIFTHETRLAPGMTATYQPQEKARWWCEKNIHSGTMVSGIVTEVCDHDFTNPNPLTNTYYVSTTYDYSSGQWSKSNSEPPSQQRTGLMKAFVSLGIGSTETGLNKIRHDLAGILRAIDLLSFQDKAGIPALSPQFYYGLVTFGSIGLCAHGLKIIVQQLIARGYAVQITLEKDQMSASLRLTPPPTHGLSLDTAFSTGNTVPPHVIRDWNAAVHFDAVDRPVNGGVSDHSVSYSPIEDAGEAYKGAITNGASKGITAY